MKKAKGIVILGPTSGGKTALSLFLAKKLHGEIISADSRQVYRGLNLGTGKVTKKEMDGVPHHLLDVADPKKQFSVAEYAALAEAAIADIVSRNKVPIICGGTGFYIDTVVHGITLPEVPPNAKLRARLARKSAPALFRALQNLDPVRAKTIDPKNPVRLIRAIEIATALGSVPKIQKHPPNCVFLEIGLDMPDEILKNRIQTRLTERIKSGMLREAKKLHALGLTWKRMNELGLEYRHMAQFLTKKLDPDVFKKNLADDIWSYAKRQRTWFRRNKKIEWFNPMEKTTPKKVLTLARKYLATQDQ